MERIEVPTEHIWKIRLLRQLILFLGFYQMGKKEMMAFAAMSASDQITVINAITRLRDPGNRVTGAEFDVTREFNTAYENFEMAVQAFLSGDVDAIPERVLADMFANVRAIRAVGRQQADAAFAGGRARAEAAGIPAAVSDRFLSPDAMLSTFTVDPETLLKQKGIIR